VCKRLHLRGRKGSLRLPGGYEGKHIIKDEELG
jgi:hypothetical protein